MNLAEVKREFLVVPLALIDEPPLPMRSTMDDEGLDALGQNIRDVGLIHPISLARNGERFEVIAGHRRTVAARRAGVVALQALVYPSRDVVLEAVKYGENMFGEAVSAADEAVYLHELLEQQCGGDTDKLAALVRRRRAYVEDRILLFQGDEQVFGALQNSQINIGIAQLLNKVTDDVHRRYLLDLAISNGATTAIMRSWVDEWRRIHEPATRNLQNLPPIDLTGAMPIPDAFVCGLCGTRDNPSVMRPLQVHTYCEHATLKPALELWNHRSDYLRAPRTVDEAVELMNDLIERFPALGGEPNA
jgi:ParB/RepB/Spo0J family partition protein